MATGLRVYSTSGVSIIDLTSSVAQTQSSVTTGGSNGSITMPSVPAGKTRFYIVVPLVDLQADRGKIPGVTVSGNTLSWSYSYATNGWGYFSANCRIYYGYY